MIFNITSWKLACRQLAWLIWGTAALYYAYEFFLRISPSVMQSDLMLAFNIDAATFGTLSACYYYAYASMQIPVGMLLDKFGIRRLLSIAAICVALGCFAFAHTHQLWVAELGRIMMGLGSAFAFISTVKLIRRWFSHALIALVIGLTNTLGVLGAIMGQAPFAKFIEYFQWRQSFVVAGFIGLGLALLIYLFIRDTPEDVCPDANIAPTEKTNSQFWSGLQQVLSNPKNWLIAIIAGLMVAPVAAFTELWGVPFLMQAHSVSKPEAGLLSSLMFIGIACGGPFHGWWSGRLGSRLPALKVGAMGAFVSLSLILFFSMSSMLVLTVLLFLFGFFTSSMLLCFAINSENNPLWATGVVIGFTNMLVMLGGAVFQPLVGHFLDLLSGHQGARVLSDFSLHNFRIALAILPVCDIIAFVLIYFNREVGQYGSQ
jgi:sugar phosphate permease